MKEKGGCLGEFSANLRGLPHGRSRTTVGGDMISRQVFFFFF